MTKESGRGRPRAFDVEVALETALGLFHTHGYGGVKVAELGEAMGIKAPSLYAAFGSKAELFTRCIGVYASRSVFVSEAVARDDVDTAGAMAEILRGAARTYADHPERRGCMVIDGARNTDDPEVCALVGEMVAATRRVVADRVATTHPEVAEAVADYVLTTMRGMSAAARSGATAAQLRDVATMASEAIALRLSV